MVVQRRMEKALSLDDPHWWKNQWISEVVVVVKKKKKEEEDRVRTPQMLLYYTVNGLWSH
jgi:hypothetical protein